jgi:hypothetical protein
MENLLMQKRMPKKICEDHAEWKLQLEMLNAKKKLLTQEQETLDFLHKLMKSQRKHSKQTEELLVGDDHLSCNQYICCTYMLYE